MNQTTSRTQDIETTQQDYPVVSDTLVLGLKQIATKVKLEPYRTDLDVLISLRHFGFSPEQTAVALQQMSDFGGRWSHLKPNHKYHAYLNEIEGLRRKHNHNLLLYGMSKRLRGAWTRHHMALLIKAGHCTTPEMASVIGLTRRAITKEVREHPYFFQRLTRGRVMLQNIEPPRPLLPFVFVSLLQPTFTELNPANVQTVLDQSDPPDIQDQVYVQNLGNECTAHNMVQDLCMVTPELLSEKCRTGRSLDPGGVLGSQVRGSSPESAD